MRFANIGGRAHIRYGGGYVDIEQATSGNLPWDPSAALERWPDIQRWAETAAARGYDGGVLVTIPEESAFLAPSPRPRQIFAVGLNYAAHAEETGLVGSDVVPLTFTKFPSSVAGPVGDLVLTSQSVDWEVELVVVIGLEAKNVPVETAWEIVAGVTVGQDFSDRDVQMTGTPPQFSLGKSYPGFGPIGPDIVTIDELADLNDIPLRCEVSGRVVQSGSTRNLVHSVPALISLYSSVCTLYPGDLIFTGTPEGVGMGHTPPVYLKPGDTVITAIPGVGTMTHRCVSAEPRED